MERIGCGKITLFREKCPNCGEYNLAGKPEFKCSCGIIYKDEIINKERMLVDGKRKLCPIKTKRFLLIKQNNKCIYCGIEFGTHIYRSGKVTQLKYHADHFIPYAYTKSNQPHNWVLACSICNSWKHDRMFSTIEDCSKYLTYKWTKAISYGTIEILL